MIQSQSVAGFFKGHPDAKRLHDLIAAAVAKLGDTQVRVTKSQVAFRRLRGGLAPESMGERGSSSRPGWDVPE